MTDQLARFRSNLTAIADAYALLATQHREVIADERTAAGYVRRHRDGKGGPLVYGQADGTMVAADPVAHALPTGPTKQAGNAPSVSGSREAPVPANLDIADLLGPANAGSLLVADLTPWPEDQVGHLALRTELGFWVRDIADVCGEREPVPTVPAMAMWLHERAGWAWDYYAALDEMVVKVDRLARTLDGMVNPRGPRPERKTAPCPGCGEALLLGDGERVWCDDQTCGRVLTEAEYGDWSRSVIVRETIGGEAMTAAAIAIKYGRSKENVHWLAHKHGWTRSDGKQRPVLYLAEDVARTMAEIIDRKTRRAAQLDSARIRKG